MKTATCRVLCVLAVLLTSVGVADAQTFTHSLPASVQVGKTTRVTCYGKGLAGVRTLWTSFPATVTLVQDPAPTDTVVIFDVTVPEGTPVGIQGWRCVTDSAISDVRLCVLDDLPILTENGNNGSIESPQALPLPTAVDGVVASEQRDFYAIEVQAGQQVAFEVVGNRLGTELDPLVVLYDSQGRNVLSYDNDEGLGFDLRFSHTFEQAGRYLVEVRDTRYQGGGNWAYHLRIGSFPVARVAFPPGGQHGQPVSFALPGRTATDVPPISMTLPTDPATGLTTLAVPGKQASAWVPVVADSAEQQVELEPNNEPENGNAFLVTRTINGRFHEPGDVDCFRFEAKKDQQIHFRGDTRRLSSPSDLYLTVLNASGAQVAVADDSGASEGELTFKVPADGEYTLTVEDLHRRGGPAFVYRLETSLGQANYTLAVGADRIVVPQASAVPVALTLARQGVADQVQVKAEGGDLPVTVAEASVARGATTSTLSVGASLDVPPGLYTMELFGSVAEQGALRRGGDFTAIVAPQLANLPYPPNSVTRRIPVLVTNRAFFSMSASVEGFVGRYLSTPLVVTANRDKFFDGEITVAVANLPPNVEIKPAPVPQGQPSVTLQVESKPKSPLGQFPVFISGTSTFQGRTATVFSEIVTLDIQPAFSLTVEPKVVTIARGATAKVTVQAIRHPGYTGPIDITLKDLPKGVTASPAKLADKQDKLELELTAAADAPIASAENPTAGGAATVGGQAETVTSPAFTVSIVEK